MIKRVTILTLLGLVIGGIVGMLAVGFVEAVLWLNDFLRIAGDSRDAVQDRLWLITITICVPAAGGLIVGLIGTRLKDNRFHTPQDAIRTALSPGATMPVKEGVLSTVAAVFSLGSGASVGQYGPLAHMGASLGSWVCRAVHYERSLRSISIACGAAAAISAAFHAPIAGLIFSREVIIRHYSLRAFAPIAVASTMAYVIAHIVFRRDPLFRLDGLVVESSWEYLTFIAIGIASAYLAKAYMRLIEFAGETSAKLAWPGPVKTMLAGAVLGVVAIQVPEVLGIGQDTLRTAMLGQTFGIQELLLILVAKLLVTALCLGFGFAGGVFSPALLIGTLFGAAIGTAADMFIGVGHSPVAVYAVCGMVAVTSPVIGAPLTAVLIVFELTQNYGLATAAMVSVAFANLIGFRIYGRSFFDVQLQARGFDLRYGRGKISAEQTTIRELLSSDYTRADVGDTLVDVRDHLVDEAHSAAYVLDADGVYVGTLSLQRLMELAAAGTAWTEQAGRFAEPEAIVFTPDTSVWSAMSDMHGFIGEAIPVIEDGRLAGALFESTIVDKYLELLDEIREEENAAV